MKKRGFLFPILLLGCVMILVQGCSKSNPSLDSLNDLPSMNAADYDLSSAAASAKLLASVDAETECAFSRAACESDTLKKQLFQDGAEVDSFLCYVKTIESLSGFSIPQEDWLYMEIHFPETEGEEGPPSYVLARTGKFGDQLRMDACVQDQNGAWQRNVEFRISSIEGGYEGFVVNQYSFTEGENTYNGNSRIDVSITGTSTTDWSAANFAASHTDNDGSSNGWTSSMTFTADASGGTNTLYGANEYLSTEWGNSGGQIHSVWGDDSAGSVQFFTNGEYDPPTFAKCQEWYPPDASDDDINNYCVGKCYDENGVQTAANDSGKCEFSQTGIESFSIDSSTSPTTYCLVEDPINTVYEEAATEATLPTLEDVADDVAFIDTWDCSVPDGVTAEEIDMTGEADALSTCMVERDESLWSLCEDQEREDMVE